MVEELLVPGDGTAIPENTGSAVRVARKAQGGMTRWSI